MIDSRCEAIADEARVASRIAMLVLVQQLTEEFAGEREPADVIKVAYRIREDLLTDGLFLDLLEATGNATRERLRGSRTFVSLVG